MNLANNISRIFDATILNMIRMMLKWRHYMIAATLFTCALLYGLNVRWVLKSTKSVILIRQNGPSDVYEPQFLTPLKRSKNETACVHPQLVMWPKEYKDVFKHVPEIKCAASKDWVKVVNGTIYVNNDVINKYQQITCVHTELVRVSDHQTILGNNVTFTYTNKNNTFWMKTDFYQVHCRTLSGETYESVVAGVHNNPNVRKRWNKSNKTPPMNVLMIGFDSLSRMTYIRKLPETYRYFTEVLGGVVLGGYNIVGDGTPQALIPILTGKTELELPRTLKRIRNSPYCDVFPMIWKDFRKAGYVTAWAEDNPGIGTFTYRMNGYKVPPTDHYMRPFYVHFESKEFEKHKPLCLGDRRRSQVYLNWLRDVFIQYHGTMPVWAFGFHSEISHGDYNNIETADKDIVETLMFLEKNSYLDNTAVILMSDHGARFSKLREFVQGKQEERRPFMGLYLPKKFRKRHPKAYNNLVTNAQRLSSPFDLHPTFLDLLNSDPTVGEKKGDVHNRSISLLREIPPERTCDQAGIEPHWCACLNWEPADIKSNNTLGAVSALVTYINELTKPQRALCLEVHLDKIRKADQLVPKGELLKFSRTNDADGYRPEFGSKTRVGQVLYQLEITTQPGNGHFEATITFDKKQSKYHISDEDISRTNKYGDDPKCVYDTHEELRKFCYCKRSANS